MADQRTLSDMTDGNQRLTRRRSSLEHDIMKHRLMEWRARKGLPVLGKYEEEKQKMPTSSNKHTAPTHSAKRKHSHLSQSERKPDRASNKLRQLDTPGSSSTSHSKQAQTSSSRKGCSTSKKQPGRRSLVPPATGSVSRQPVKKAKQEVCLHKEEAPLSATGLPLADRTNEPVVTNIIPVQSQEDGISKKAKMPCVLNRKSVRFVSPQEATRQSVHESTEASSEQMAPLTPASSVKLGMRERLEQWLISRGKTPSRFHNFLGYESSLAWSRHGQKRTSGTPHYATPGRGRKSAGTSGPGGGGPMEHGDGATVSDAMKECFVMLEEGCPLSYISSWLDRLVTKIPLIQQSAAYWLCRAKIAEKERGDQSAVECLFEAVEFGAEPSKEIEESLAAYRLKLKLASEDSRFEWEGGHETGALSPPVRCSPCLQPQTPIARLQFDEEEVMHQSDAEETDGSRSAIDTSHLSIKYSLKETTPYFARIHCTPGQAPTTPCLMVTPVRRSARLDNKRRSVVALGQRHSQSPTAVASHRECLDSVQEVANAFPGAQLILRPNTSLAAEFSEGELLK